MSETIEKRPVIEVTEEELKQVCGEFFDVGYYSALYQDNHDDNSLKVYSIAEKNILTRLYKNKGLVNEVVLPESGAELFNDSGRDV